MLRPQIRSLPLCKVECPQFSWAVRNNSEKNCLEAEVCEKIPDEKTCYCVERKLEPTLFPHPASCVCSDGPFSPNNEKYRYCKLKLDQTIGDVMEEVALDSIPQPPPCSEFYEREKIMKKIIRSSYVPGEVDLTDENACVECLAKDPILLKQLMDSLRNEDKRSVGKSFAKPKEEDKRCKWKRDLSCTCKKTSPRPDDTKKTVVIEGGFPRKTANVQTEKQPSPRSPKKPGKKGGKKAKVKSPKKQKPKKSKPKKVTVGRLELVENNPFYHEEEEEREKHQEAPSPVQIYEHFRAVRTASSKSTFEAPEPRKSAPKRTKSKPKKPERVPWNWNNQPKFEDPMRGWGGTKYSWSKRLDYAKFGKKLEEEEEAREEPLELRNQSGDLREEEEDPRYYEYKPNLRPENLDQAEVAPDEEEIKKKEQRRFRKGYGRMRVRSWNEALGQNEGGEAEERSEGSLGDQNGDQEDHDRKHCLQCLMSDVQERFLGSASNLCPHSGEGEGFDGNQGLLEDGENPSEASGDKRLPTIIEETPNKHEAESRMAGTYRVGSPEGSPEPPCFNVIKQRIHSRNKTLDDLDRFRSNLFAKAKKKGEEHTCVHRFAVDERLFPKPLHCDDSGASCCVHCDKPMAPEEKTVFLDQRDSKEKVAEGVQKQVSKFSLRPKPVHIGGRGSVMEIRLKPEQRDLPKGYGGGKKREFYPDSLALRHQRR